MASAPGPRLGRYLLVRKLGEGGMGAIWMAEDITLRRPVAIKFLLPRHADRPEFRSRFLREARAAAALSHPNVCTIHEVGEAQEDLETGPAEDAERIPRGTPYLAMEYVEGETLRELLARRGPLPLEELVDIAVQVAEGLAAAHRQRIVHRDLKPANIMIGPGGRVKVLDFGLARVLDAEDDAPAASTGSQLSTRLTSLGQVMGTVPYMSPEQAAGRPVDVRSDMFSLGVVLYEMAAGRRPFEADTPTSTIARILEREPPPLRDLVPELPPRLEAIVRRCLAKRPEDRWRDTRDLVGALRDLQEEVRSGTISRAPRFRRALARAPRRWTVLAGGAVVLALLLALAWWTLSRPRAALPPPAAAEEATFPAFFDDFDTPPAPRGDPRWRIFHFDPRLWRPAVRPGFLTLWTHQGDTWNENRTGMKARNLVGHEFTGTRFQATTCIRDFWPQKVWQQADLVVFADEDNYVRLGIIAHHDTDLRPPANVHMVQGVFERNGEVSLFPAKILGRNRFDSTLPFEPRRVSDGPLEAIWLRICRAGDEWSLRYSRDGVTYLELARARFPLRTRYVGLVAFHGIGRGRSTDLTWDPIPAHFDFLRIEPYP